MEIGWPTDVQHVNHVTFDRFDGFLGLPVEFEPEVPRRAPSASATVFGVSTQSMQLSYDLRGNSIPTILLLMQRHLYCQGGLQAEGIFRITAGNSQEEFVRDQLNRGVVPEGIDVHCLAGLIKAWFRELPRGVLDSLSAEQVMQCSSEEDCEALVGLLPPTEAALLDWAVNLMADVVQEEHLNKMNARNIAMVFAPNMTQMVDPLTALMHAVQVMNFLKTLIEKTLREREDSIKDPPISITEEPSDDNGNHHNLFPQLHQQNPDETNDDSTHPYLVEDPCSDFESETKQFINSTDEDCCYLSYSTSSEESDESVSCGTSPGQANTVRLSVQTKPELKTDGDLGSSKIDHVGKGVSNLSRINSRTERCEAWR
ncbi:Rho GTPase-activating protein 1 [Striga hermonthica]|uniref:Rho GTPase-activating protein 1 n=1 Tax=Striga hermonthica TaxID=68872 RepID=A0A9N7RF65_STRHE|nr:Rho GTPase-activating protein 1 [Striga hermonthica]